MGHFFLRKPALMAQVADVGAESYRIFVHDNLATGADCRDATGDLDY